jgi:ATP-dependent 26S proteasome regulatory subunit
MHIVLCLGFMPRKPLKPPVKKTAGALRDSSDDEPPRTAKAAAKPAAAPSNAAKPESSARHAVQVVPATKAPILANTVAATPATAPPPALVTVSCVAPLFGTCKENHIELPHATMRKAGVTAGSLAVVTSTKSSVELILVVSAAKDVAPPHAALHPETLVLLEGKEAEVAPLDGQRLRATRDLVGPANTVKLVRLELASDASQAAREATFSAAQVEAAIVQKFDDEVVFDRMIARVTLSGISVPVRVELPGGSSHGRITRFTTTIVEPLLCAEVDGPEDSAANALPKRPTVSGAGHVLLVGAAGTGKTFELLRRRNDHVDRGHTAFTIHANELIARTSADACTELRQIFRDAAISSPSVVLCDDAHVAFGASSAATNDPERAWKATLLSSTLSSLLDSIASDSVTVIFTCPSATSLDRALTRAGRLSNVVKCEPPSSPAERIAVLSRLLEGPGRATLSSDVIADVGEGAFGFVQADLNSVVTLARSIAFNTSSTFVITNDSLREAAKRIRPSAIRNFDVSIPKVLWSDIGGSNEAKETLQECVRWCLGEQRSLFARLNLTPPRGVLLYGPPGCSKTMLAKALACESRLNFIAVKGPRCSPSGSATRRRPCAISSPRPAPCRRAWSSSMSSTACAVTAELAASAIV